MFTVIINTNKDVTASVSYFKISFRAKIFLHLKVTGRSVNIAISSQSSDSLSFVMLIFNQEN